MNGEPVPQVTVVGLGPGGPEMISVSALRALENPHSFLRTRKHPAAQRFANASSFDHIYDAAEKIEDVYPAIVDELVDAALQHGGITYAVPGSPLVAEATVSLLRNDSRVRTTVIPALSFIDLCWQELGIDPLDVSPRIVDGRRFATQAAGERGPMLVVQCDQDWVLSDIKLAYEGATPAEVTVLQRLGSSDAVVATVAWEDLDRVVEPDERTSLWVDHASEPVAMQLARLERVANELREKCPWDAEQTHASLAKHLIEESYEALEAMQNTDDDHLIEELGDVLFQVYAHCAIAAQQGRFTIADVAAEVADKLIGRHPHVYGNIAASSSDEVAQAWEANKMLAKGRQSAMDGIPPDLPALMYAAKIVSRATRAGFKFDSRELDKSDSGDLLLAIVAKLVDEDADAETLLRLAANRYRERFCEYENRLK